MLRGVTPQARDQYLAEAAESQAWLTVAVRGAPGGETYKSRLLGVRADAQTLVVEYPAGKAGRPAPDIDEGRLLGITFRRGARKHVFTSMVVGKDRVAVSGTSQVGVLLLRWPEEMQELQRRAYQRVDVPASWDISVGFWPENTRLSPRRPPPPPSLESTMTNLSAGGLAVTVPTDAAEDLILETVFACRFTPVKHHPPFHMHARLRHIDMSAEATTAMLGMQFVRLEFSPRMLGRLVRVVTQFQRYSPSPARR